MITFAFSFLFPWLVALVLILNAPRKQMLVLTGLFIVVYILASNGVFGPSALGALLLISIPGAVLMCVKKE